MSLNHSPQIVTNGLVLCLDAADIKSYPRTGTTWFDRSGNGNNGTLVNTPTYSNGAIVFDGSNDYCDIPITAVPTGNQITISCWTKVNTIQESSLFSAFNSSGSREINIHIPWSNNIAYWDCGANGGSSCDRINTDVLTIAQRTNWHNWVFTKNATTGIMTIYLDGVALVSGSGKTAVIGSISATSKRCAIASFSLPPDIYYSGTIGNMIFYSRELTTAEILQNYNAMKGRYGV